MAMMFREALTLSQLVRSENRVAQYEYYLINPGRTLPTYLPIPQCQPDVSLFLPAVIISQSLLSHVYFHQNWPWFDDLSLRAAKMGKSTAKTSLTQVQSIRARFRKASCMNDDSYDEDIHLGEPLHAQPWTPTYEQPGTEFVLSSETRHDNGEAHEQVESAFFTKLPVELRRMIYTELWRSCNPLMKMHIHGSATGPRLTTTSCRYEPKATYSTRDDEVDPMRTDPWPAWRSRNQPPRWFWHAWGLRLRWGVHWKCQAAAMMDWHPRGDGTCEDLRGADVRWLGCFLTCRKM